MARLLRVVLPALHPTQRAVLDHPARFRLVVAGRRWGKTLLGVVACLVVALAGGRAWWVAPSYPMAQLGWRPLRRLAARIPGVEINVVDRLITFPGGGEIQVRSADRPDSLRGIGLDLVVIDEAALVDEAAWTEALRPALADRKGRALFLTTPKGTQGWLWEAWEKAATPEGVRLGWERFQHPTSDNPHIDPAEIAAARDDLHPTVFAQEFLAEFITPGGDVFRAEWIRRFDLLPDVDRFDPSTSVVLMDQGRMVESTNLGKCRRWATVDLAASTKTSADYTAAGAMARTPQGRLLVVDMLRDRLESPDLVPKLAELRDRWQLAYLGVESVALGLGIVQFMRRAGLPVRPITADRDKVSRALLAAARMSGGYVWIRRAQPWSAGFEAELLSFPTGEFDDQVDVLSYAAVESKQGGLVAW